MKIAFDIDDTLFKIRVNKRDQVPDYDLIQVLKWFYQNGDEIYVWSAGGIDYTENFVKKMGLDDMVAVIRKGSIKVDIAFDDEETNLAIVDVKINRNTDTEQLREISIQTQEKIKKRNLF